MAGDWIVWSKGFAKKPEILRLAAAFGMTRQHVAACCMEVWEWFDENTVDGHAPSVTRFLLDDIAGRSGFTDSMIEVGWLVLDADTLRVPKFERWNSQTAKARLLASKRKQKQRTTAGQLSQNGHAASVTKQGTKAGPEKEKEKELTTTAVGTQASEKSRLQTEAQQVADAAGVPIQQSSFLTGETIVAKPAKPAKPGKPEKPPVTSWASERYAELLTVVADGMTFAKGMPLLNKLAKQYGKLVVEQAISELHAKAQVVEFKDLYRVFNARCQQIAARPPVSSRPNTDRDVSAENQSDPNEYVNHWRSQA